MNLSNTWKPNGTIAFVLGFFLQPFTFLYVGRGKAFLFSMLSIFLGAFALFFSCQTFSKILNIGDGVSDYYLRFSVGTVQLKPKIYRVLGIRNGGESCLAD